MALHGAVQWTIFMCQFQLHEKVNLDGISAMLEIRGLTMNALKINNGSFSNADVKNISAEANLTIEHQTSRHASAH